MGWLCQAQAVQGSSLGLIDGRAPAGELEQLQGTAVGSWAVGCVPSMTFLSSLPPPTVGPRTLGQEGHSGEGLSLEDRPESGHREAGFRAI